MVDTELLQELQDDSQKYFEALECLDEYDDFEQVCKIKFMQAQIFKVKDEDVIKDAANAYQYE